MTFGHHGAGRLMLVATTCSSLREVSGVLRELSSAMEFCAAPLMGELRFKLASQMLLLLESAEQLCTLTARDLNNGASVAACSDDAMPVAAVLCEELAEVVSDARDRFLWAVDGSAPEVSARLACEELMRRLRAAD